MSFLENLHCPNVQQLQCGANATYTDNIADELQDSTAQVFREDITTKGDEESSCISFLADESTDISAPQMLVM